jgi:asparagine synthase (glutamine-hydrolysing)
MPGLVGLITRMPRERAEAELFRMVAALQHESRYVSGTWSDEALGLYVGWVERNGPFADCMPLYDEQRNLILAFSGEDFSESGTAQHLNKDSDFPKRLNGRFHGVLADRTNEITTLFNDRYGMHRIYYHQAKEAFYFAAEAKAILAIRPELRSVDPDGLAEFVSCGCTLNNRTLFKDIHVLPPASAWTFQHAAIARKGVYFDPKEWEEQSLLEPEAYYEQLQEVFSRRLTQYFGGLERIGVSLTGGLDSRMIMSWCRALPGSLPCYSFGSSYHDSQDVVIARKVARACGQRHEVISVGDEFLKQFHHYSERTVFLTDGCVEVKHSADLYVNERAAQIAPVRMTGNYGGEVLRRVRALKAVNSLPGLFQPDFVTHVERAKQTYNGLLHGHPLSFALFCQAPWHHYGLLSLEQSQLSLRSPFLDNEFVKTIYRAPQSALSSDDLSLRLIEDGNPELRRIRTDRGIGGNLPSWASAMRRSYLEFTFKAEYAYDYGMPHSIARLDSSLATLRLERLFLGRHKFYHFRVWYRDALASYIREMLLDGRTLARPYLQRDTLERMVKDHLGGTRNYTTAIHKILTLEHFHRLFIDAI